MNSFTLKHAVETAIHAEELGINFYSKLAKKFSDNKEISDVFDLLAKDEVEHKKQFQGLLEESSKTQFSISEDDELYFKGCDISKYFPSMKEIDEKITVEEVLKNAFEFEKDSVLFYTGIRDMIPVKDKLDVIISKEREHMTKLMKYIVADSKFRGIEDKF